MAQITWIGGWGVNPERLRPLALSLWPDANHAFLAPVRGAAEAAADSADVVAWSLGALRVLDAASRGVLFRGRVRLLAPFAAFCAEHDLGGRCSVAQVRWLRRWLQRDPGAALGDFYQRARLGGPPSRLPYAAEDLLEGLDVLARDASPALREFVSRGLPEHWSALVGDGDPLLDASAVCRALPGCRMMRGAGHACEELAAGLHPGAALVIPPPAPATGAA